jgi:KEOPS complex subunit Pcc1
MRAKATIRLHFSSVKHLETVYRALMPETKKSTSTRSKASLEKNRTFLVLKVNAKDTVALRAALNTYLRWINSMANVLEFLKKHQQETN